MNNWNKLKSILDDIFGHGETKQSRISRKVQLFDNKTNERVIRIEYRIKMMNESSLPLLKSINDKTPSHQN